MSTPPPPPGYPQQPPYGGGPAPYGQMNAREHPDGTLVLVLGIISLVVCALTGPFAWAKGSKARKEMAAQPQIHWTNSGSITAGWVCGIIGSVLLMLSIAVIILVFVLAAASA